MAAKSADVVQWKHVAESWLLLTVVSSQDDIALAIDEFIIKATMVLIGSETNLCAGHNALHREWQRLEQLVAEVRGEVVEDGGEDEDGGANREVKMEKSVSTEQADGPKNDEKWRRSKLLSWGSL